ncbi:MAG: POTRA domain-containing protein, partial [Longimicrobiales bacterium]
MRTHRECAEAGRARTRREAGKAVRCGVLLAAGAALVLGGCAMRGGAAERYPELLEYESRRISDVDFLGAEPFHEDSLLSITETRESRCSLLGLPICVPFTAIGREEHSLSVGTVAADVRRLELFYRGHGYFGTAVAPRVEDDGDDVRVIFAIARGEPVLLDSITVAGTEPVFPPDSILPMLPLAPGDTFRLPAFAAAADTVLGAMRMEGHAYAQVLRNYAVDTLLNSATASIEAVPGPRVVVDTIIVRGVDHLGENEARRQLTFREGDVLRRSLLLESQRNLYSLELVQFASVSVAPDSLQRVPVDSTRATVLLSVAEAPVRQVDAALGYGDVECGRAEVRWVNRSFGGGARRLALGAA